MFIFTFSDRTKSASHFGNDILNYVQEEKSDAQNNEITRTFGYKV